MKLSAKARTALQTVIDQFQSGDLSPLVEIARIQREGDPIPAEQWSFCNRVLAYIQTGSLDCRGYRQWQKAGRQVRKGEQAAYILAPCISHLDDKDTGERIAVLRGFKPVAVFACHQTEGEELVDADYSPAELPPLAHVAESLGVAMHYLPLPPDRLGDCDSEGSRINLGTHDHQVFFHELAHAAHARVEGRLKGGQDSRQETIAEFTATVLMHLYGLGDRTGNCWRYIQSYADDPVRAIVKALSTVEKILALLLSPQPDVDRI